MGYTSKLIASAELVNDSETVVVKAEDQATIVYSTPNGGESEITGKVLGIELGGTRPSSNQYGPLYDGIATSVYNSDKLGNFRNASSHYSPEAFLIEVEGEEEGEVSNVYVPVNKIQSIEVTPANVEDSQTLPGDDTPGQEGIVETPDGPTGEDNF